MSARIPEVDRTTSAPGLRGFWVARENRTGLVRAHVRGLDWRGIRLERAALLFPFVDSDVDCARRRGAFARRRLEIFSLVGLLLRAVLDFRANGQHLLGALLVLQIRRLSLRRQNLVERDWTRLDQRRTDRSAGRCSSA